MKSITVRIDGHEFNLRGNDEALVGRAASAVNSQIELLRSKYKDDVPMSTVYILAALNLAEILETERLKFDEERENLIDEITKMSEYLNDYLKTGAGENTADEDSI